MSLISINWNPDRSKLREFALVWLVGWGLIGLLVAWQLGSLEGRAGWSVPLVVWGMGVLICLMGLLYPPSVKPVYLAWMGLTFPIGWLMSHLVLALIYFGLLTPLALFFRLRKRDPLQLRREPRDSYWHPYPVIKDKARYFRQF